MQRYNSLQQFTVVPRNKKLLGKPPQRGATFVKLQVYFWNTSGRQLTILLNMNSFHHARFKLSKHCRIFSVTDFFSKCGHVSKGLWFFFTAIIIELKILVIEIPRSTKKYLHNLNLCNYAL